MNILINGEIFKFENNITIGELVKIRNLEGKLFVIEKNLNIIPKTEYDSTVLSDGDSIEIATLCGGG